MRKKKFLALLLTTGLVVSSGGGNIISARATESSTEVSSDSENSESTVTRNILYETSASKYEGKVLGNDNPTTYQEGSKFTIVAGKISMEKGYAVQLYCPPYYNQPRDILTFSDYCTSDLTISLEVSPISYSISYDLDGGTLESTNPSRYTVESSKEFNSPTKEGYTFVGWRNIDTGGIITSTEGLCENLSLVAVWEENTTEINTSESATEDATEVTEYSITYQLNSAYGIGMMRNMNPDKYSTLKDTTLSVKNIQSAQGYVLDGLISPGIADFPREEIIIPKGTTGDIVVEVVYHYRAYSITYDLDGGVNSENNPAKFTMEDSFVLEEPIKEGYNFVKWVEYSTFTDTETDFSGEVVGKFKLGNIYLRAKWEKIEDSTSEESTKVSTEVPTTGLLTDVTTQTPTTVPTTEKLTEVPTTVVTTEKVTEVETTEKITTESTTIESTTTVPTTEKQTEVVTTTTEEVTTIVPTTEKLTEVTTEKVTVMPTTSTPTTEKLTEAITTEKVTTAVPTTEKATVAPTTEKTTVAPTTEKVTTAVPTTEKATIAPTTEKVTIAVPTTEKITTAVPTTEKVTTAVPTTEKQTEVVTTEKATVAPTTEKVTEIVTTEGTTAVSTTEKVTISTTQTTEIITTEKATVEATTEVSTQQATTQEKIDGIAPKVMYTYGMYGDYMDITGQTYSEEATSKAIWVMDSGKNYTSGVKSVFVNGTQVGTKEGKYTISGIGTHTIVATDNDGNESTTIIKLTEEVKLYDIIYDMGGHGTNNLDNPTKYSTSSTAVNKIYDPTPDLGWYFTGWYCDGLTSSPVVDFSIPKNDIDGPITLVATWSPTIYSIEYNLDGGENNSKNPTVYTVEDVVSFETPTKDGYTFDGWYLDENYSRRVSVLPKGSIGYISVYAKWVQDATTTEAVTSEQTTEELTTVESTTEVATSEVTTEQITSEQPTTEVITTEISTEQSTTEKTTNSTVVRKKLSTPKISKVTKVKKGFKLTFKKAKMGKYQIKVSTLKTFKKKRTKTYKTSKKTYSIKKLKRGKVYYVRVRLYNVDSKGKIYYGKWSKVRKVKITK